MLKTTLFIAALFVLATGCKTVRPGASRQSSTTAAAKNSSSSGSVQFIDNISVNASGKQDRAPASVGSVTTESNAGPSGVAPDGKTIETYSALRFKYAILENVPVEEMSNTRLLSFMDYWYGAPYRYGGMSRDGIDCSAFAFLLMSSVYGVASLPRTSKEQYELSRHIRRSELQEGDLVFFHTLGKRRSVTHVGVYLRNNKFIHASVSGVMISDLGDSYYNRHYVGAGRVLTAGRDESSTVTTAVVGASH